LSLANVWAQAISYLESQDIPFVETIFQYPERQTPNSSFFPKDQPGITTSVVIWSWVSDGEEFRFASGANGPPPNGQKWVSYQLHLNCVLRSAYANQGNPTIGDEVQLAAADNTTFIDAMRTAIRYSRNAGGKPVGTGTAIFQWGEGPSDHWAEDIKWHSDTPVTLEGAGVAGLVEIRTRFDISVCETINS
jgi:hypothetical protein